MKRNFLYIPVWALLGLALSTAVVFAQAENKPFIKNQKLIVDPIPLDLEQLTLFADRVFSGVPLNRKEKVDPKTNIPVIEYTFKISEIIKDKNKRIGNKKKVTFKQWKPISSDVDFSSDKRYVVFLNADSSIGFTSPVGLWQGQFEIEQHKVNGIKIDFVRNRLNNKGLGKNLKTKKVISIEGDKALNDYISRASETGQPIKYREFVKSIKALDRGNSY